MPVHLRQLARDRVPVDEERVEAVGLDVVDLLVEPLQLGRVRLQLLREAPEALVPAPAIIRNAS